MARVVSAIYCKQLLIHKLNVLWTLEKQRFQIMSWVLNFDKVEKEQGLKNINCRLCVVFSVSTYNTLHLLHVDTGSEKPWPHAQKMRRWPTSRKLFTKLIWEYETVNVLHNCKHEIWKKLPSGRYAWRLGQLSCEVLIPTCNTPSFKNNMHSKHMMSRWEL